MTSPLNRHLTTESSSEEHDVFTVKHKLTELGYVDDYDLSQDGIPKEAMVEALAHFQDDDGIEELVLWGAE